MQDIMVAQKTIQTHCPSCDTDSEFTHLGEQKWSEAIAKKLGIPTIVNLYNCEHCQTTLTDIQLKPKNS
ncbi:MAG: hypothetical protein Phog2KO_45530 [Phototrophicaceae bacterium]